MADVTVRTKGFMDLPVEVLSPVDRVRAEAARGRGNAPLVVFVADEGTSQMRLAMDPLQAVSLAEALLVSARVHLEAGR